MRKRFRSGSLGELSSMASSRLSRIRAGATSSMKTRVIFTDDQNAGSARTAW